VNRNSYSNAAGAASFCFWVAPYDFLVRFRWTIHCRLESSQSYLRDGSRSARNARTHRAGEEEEGGSPAPALRRTERRHSGGVRVAQLGRRVWGGATGRALWASRIMWLLKSSFLVWKNFYRNILIFNLVLGVLAVYLNRELCFFFEESSVFL